MKFSFGNMTVEMNIFNVSKQIGEHEDIREVDLIQTIFQEHLESMDKGSIGENFNS
jgi:hypothetical protein